MKSSPECQEKSVLPEPAPDLLARVAQDEHVSVEMIQRAFAAGTVVIPYNRNRRLSRIVAIGSDLRTKVNVNLGTSPEIDDPVLELAKMRCALSAGADTIMDLSTGPKADDVLRAVLAECPVPVGTVPVYTAVSRVSDAAELKAADFISAVENHAQLGVDFMTIHAGILREHLASARNRILGIVSRGGSLLARWMSVHGKQNPLYEHFDEVLQICRTYRVTISLGDGLRPGCLADASDVAQFSELHVISELVDRCREAGVQVMVEGPGHIPFDEIEMNIRLACRLAKGAPLYVLGPVVTDIAPGYDHIVAAIGATAAAYYGAAFLCVVTPSEHLGLPDCRDIHEGTIAFRIAAHAADVAREKPYARESDDAISKARREFDWETQFRLALDRDRAREIWAMRQPHKLTSACSMCGEKYCAVRISDSIFNPHRHP